MKASLNLISMNTAVREHRGAKALVVAGLLSSVSSAMAGQTLTVYATGGQGPAAVAGQFAEKLGVKGLEFRDRNCLATALGYSGTLSSGEHSFEDHTVRAALAKCGLPTGQSNTQQTGASYSAHHYDRNQAMTTAAQTYAPASNTQQSALSFFTAAQPPANAYNSYAQGGQSSYAQTAYNNYARTTHSFVPTREYSPSPDEIIWVMASSFDAHEMFRNFFVEARFPGAKYLEDSDLRCISRYTGLNFVQAGVYYKLRRGALENYLDVCKINLEERLASQNTVPNNQSQMFIPGNTDPATYERNIQSVDQSSPGDPVGNFAYRFCSSFPDKLVRSEENIGRQGSTREFCHQIAAQVIREHMKHGILASVSFAQMALESSWGMSELALFANALAGIKWHSHNCLESMSYVVATKEHVGNDVQTVREPFCKYSSWAKSIEDRSMYLLRRGLYGHLLNQSSYIDWAWGFDGVYATDREYALKLIRLIETYNLQQLDAFACFVAPQSNCPLPL